MHYSGEYMRHNAEINKYNEKKIQKNRHYTADEIYFDLQQALYSYKKLYSLIKFGDYAGEAIDSFSAQDFYALLISLKDNAGELGMQLEAINKKLCELPESGND